MAWIAPQTLLGFDVYRAPKDAPPVPWPEALVQEVLQDRNLVTTKDGLKDGDLVVVRGFTGWALGVVQVQVDLVFCISPDGRTFYNLEFAQDRPEPEPPRWVCYGAGNLAALRKLEISG